MNRWRWAILVVVVLCLGAAAGCGDKALPDIADGVAAPEPILIASGESDDSGSLVILASSDSGSTWDTSAIPELKGSIECARMASAEEGWVVGSGDGDTPLVLRTEDGGATWAEQSVPSGVGRVLSITCLDKSTAWALADSAGGSVALQTADGGKTWSQVSLLDSIGDGEGPNSGMITFSTDEVGWINAEDLVLRTDDGGTTWVEQTFPGVYGGWFTSIEFTDDASGWFVHNADSDGCEVIRTTDAGASWMRFVIPEMVYAFDADFVDSQTGWVVGYGEDTVLLVKTSDGGETWQQQTILGITDGDDQPRVFSVLDSETAVLIPSYPMEAIARTTDGGTTWALSEVQGGVSLTEGVVVFGK